MYFTKIGHVTPLEFIKCDATIPFEYKIIKIEAQNEQSSVLPNFHNKMCNHMDTFEIHFQKKVLNSVVSRSWSLFWFTKGFLQSIGQRKKSNTNQCIVNDIYKVLKFNIILSEHLSPTIYTLLCSVIFHSSIAFSNKN